MIKLKSYYSSFFFPNIWSLLRDLKQKFYINLSCWPPQKLATLSYMKDNFCSSELKAKKVQLILLALLISSWWICTLGYAPSQFSVYFVAYLMMSWNNNALCWGKRCEMTNWTLNSFAAVCLTREWLSCLKTELICPQATQNLSCRRSIIQCFQMVFCQWIYTKVTR